MQLTKEQIAKASTCNSVEELLALAKAEGQEISREEAEKYFSQLTEQKLDLNEIDKVAGGCFTHACAGDACANLC